MLVRSQDNKILSDDLNIRIDKHCVIKENTLGCVQEGYEIRNKHGILGVYETEDKAIKVLDMIEDQYGRLNATPFIFPSLYGNARTELAKANLTEELLSGVFALHIFQMPAEEEVED